MQIIQRVARLIAVSGFILVAGSSWASEKLIEKLWELDDKVLFAEVKSSFSVNSSRQLLSFVELRGEAFIQSKISYKNLKGESFENEVEPLLYHLVNHGTYHRGQVTTMLRELGVTHLASTDIIFYLRTLKDSLCT